MGSNQNCQEKKKRYLNRFEMISYDFKNRVSAHSLIAKLCYSCPMPTWELKSIFSKMLTFKNLCGRTSALKEVGNETEWYP